MTRAKQSTYVSVMMTLSEKEHLEQVVAASGKNRNRYLRDLIAAQEAK